MCLTNSRFYSTTIEQDIADFDVTNIYTEVVFIHVCVWDLKSTKCFKFVVQSPVAQSGGRFY